MLSYEKTPTLCNTLPAFEAMKHKWAEHQDDHPDSVHIVQKGVDKLANYHNRVDDVLVYVLTMGKVVVL